MNTRDIIAAFFYGGAFVSAWLVLFGPSVLVDRSRMLRAFLLACAATILVLVVPRIFIDSSAVLTILLILAFSAIVFEMVAMFRHKQKTLAPALTGIYALFTVPTTLNVPKLNSISVDWSNDNELLWTHLMLIALFFVVGIVLGLRFLRKKQPIPMASAITGAILFCLGVISFFLTMPLGGDEMSIMWFLFVLPLFLIAGIILLIALLPMIIITLSKQRNSTT